jgi:CDP-glycerol glycerophosphotransferase (TagB/SpsB family)
VVFISKYASLLFSTDEKAAYYRTMIEALRQLPPVHVIVKVHPNEQFDLLREQVGGWGWPEAILTRDYDIHRLFGAADAAVMVTSQAGFEAMALDCPVVAVQQAGKDYEGGYMPPFVSAGVVERVDMGDPSALAGALGRLLGDRDAREALVTRARSFAAPFLHPADGALGARVLAMVDELTTSSTRGARP